MTRSALDSNAIPCGIGIGLRIEFASELFADATTRIDFLEIHPENYVDRGGAHISILERAMERAPILTHGLTMGFGGVEAPTLARLRALRGLLDRVGSPLHSDHFCFASANGRYAHELLPLPFDAQTRDVAVERLTRLRDAIERPVAIENVSYYVPRSRDPLDEIAVLADILERSDAKLLLDVNNVVVNAHNHGFDPREWLERVPYHRVAQIHVAGHLIRPDGLRIDTHGDAVDAEVTQLLGEVLLRTGPVPVLLERDSEMPTFAVLSNELGALGDIYDRAMASYAAPGVVRVPPAYELRSCVSAGEMPERETEPRELAERETAVVQHLFAPTHGSLGSGLVEERWNLYRRMARGRLIDLFTAAYPRTRAAIGHDAFAELVHDFLSHSEIDTPIFWRVADALGVFASERLGQGTLALDLIQLERATWRVRHAPYANVTSPETFDFARPALINPAREVMATCHAVHEAAAEGIAPRSEESTLVVFRRTDDTPATLSMNELAAAIFHRLGRGSEPVRDAVAVVAQERDVRIDGPFLEALATTFAQWIELGLVLGSVREPAIG